MLDMAVFGVTPTPSKSGGARGNQYLATGKMVEGFIGSYSQTIWRK